MTTSVDDKKEDKRSLNKTQDSMYLYRNSGKGKAKEPKGGDDGAHEEANKISERTEGTQDLSESTAAESETASPMSTAKRSVGFLFNKTTESDETSPTVPVAKKQSGFFYNLTHLLQGKTGKDE